MADPQTITDRAGRLFTLVFVVCLGLLGCGLFLQHVKGLDPCPWCVVLRLAFIAVGLVGLVAALHRPKGAGIAVYSVLGVLVALAGVAAATYHVLLQKDPKRAAACIDSPVERLLDASGIGDWVPPLLQYGGPCTLEPWSLLGLSIPQWALVWFVILAITLALLPWLSRR